MKDIEKAEELISNLRDVESKLGGVTHLLNDTAKVTGIRIYYLESGRDTNPSIVVDVGLQEKILNFIQSEYAKELASIHKDLDEL